MEDDTSAVDPVCGMSVVKANAQHQSFRGGQAWYFCSAGCKATFDEDPRRFMAQPGSREASEGRQAH